MILISTSGKLLTDTSDKNGQSDETEEKNVMNVIATKLYGYEKKT